MCKEVGWRSFDLNDIHEKIRFHAINIGMDYIIPECLIIQAPIS